MEEEISVIHWGWRWEGYRGEGELQQGVCHFAVHEAGAVDLERRRGENLKSATCFPSWLAVPKECGIRTFSRAA